MEKIKIVEDKYKGILESAPDAIVIVDEQGKIQIINIQTEKLFGYMREELKGKEVEILIPSKYKYAHQQHRKNFSATPSVRTMGRGMELFGQHKNGKVFPVAISISKLETDDKSLVFATIRDVTYEKGIEKSLILAKENTEKTNQILKIKNKEITDSISYALRLQKAILPPTKIVKQYLESSFILYNPKDIVAGDFYWMETKENQILFAAADCTGHGVPGAMVSVVCHNALNRAVREFGLTQPSAILDKTRELVIENFSKSEEEIKDGMDISLCCLDTETKNLQWAGANNPLWLIQNGTLVEIKGDKQAIGKNENKISFTHHQLTLNSEDEIYLFTDGFADQFGGDKKQKKLTRKRFKELLLAIQHIPFQERGNVLDDFITDFSMDVEQIDDILIMGVKI